MDYQGTFMGDRAILYRRRGGQWPCSERAIGVVPSATPLLGHTVHVTVKRSWMSGKAGKKAGERPKNFPGGKAGERMSKRGEELLDGECSAVRSGDKNKRCVSAIPPVAPRLRLSPPQPCLRIVSPP